MIKIPRRVPHRSIFLLIFTAMVIVSAALVFQHYQNLKNDNENYSMKRSTNNIRLREPEVSKAGSYSDDPLEDHEMVRERIVNVFKIGKSKRVNSPHNIRRFRLFQNITVDAISDNLYSVVSDDYDFTPDDFGPKLIKEEGITNDLHIDVLIDGHAICRDHPPFLLIIIPSLEARFQQRQVIRKTWMEAALTNRWPGEDIKHPIRYVFFLGKHKKFSRDSLHRVEHEASLYQDIVLVDIIEAYSNLSRKIISALQWVNEYCDKAEYILKLDEDTFVNVPLILQVISYVEKRVHTNRFVLGKIHSSFKPEVSRVGRWAVNSQDYPFDVFPRYMYGHSYVISRASIPLLVAMNRHVRLIPPEDVYVTGILTKLANVTRVDAQCFTVCCTDLFDCGIVWNEYVTITAASSPQDHSRLWRSLVNGRCHPQVAFNHEKRHPHVNPITS